MTRTVRHTAPDRGAPLVAIVLLLALLVAACGAATVSPSAGSSASPAASAAGSGAPASGGAASGGAASGGAASPGASDEAVGPSPTSWPGGVVEAVIILGKADQDIKAAGADLGAAAAYEDLEAMWGAADGLATLIARLQTQVDRIRDYPVSAPAAQAYDAAFPDMLAGATKIRDSITAGDATGLTAGFQQLAKGTQAYEEARRLIGPLVEPALLMQRILVK